MSNSRPNQEPSRTQRPILKQERPRKTGTKAALNPVPDTGDKPYGLVPLPAQSVDRKNPAHRDKTAGHDRFRQDLISGKMNLKLTVQTSLFVASGEVALGSDFNQKIGLIQTAVSRANKLIIPGSSLKGVIRSAYEALTLSCICKTKARDKLPESYSECTVNTKRNKFNVCPACRVFGAMGWQGLIAFPDAVGQGISNDIEFMPSLFGPQPKNSMYDNQGEVSGRKFYYHTVEAASQRRTLDGKVKKGIDAQKAKPGHIFETKIQFKNLTKAELGTLFVILGQDDSNSIALKVGGGKPTGMGSLVTEIESLDKFTSPKDRYTKYDLSKSTPLTDELLKEFIKDTIDIAMQELIQQQQLQELFRILAWSEQRDRTAPEDMY